MDILCLGSLLLAHCKIFCHSIIQSFLIRSQIIRNRLGISVFVERLAIPILHILFQTTDKELVATILTQLSHSLSRQIICSKDIFIQKLHQKLESIFPSSVRCGGKQEQMLTLLGEHTGCLISLAAISLDAIFVG